MYSCFSFYGFLSQGLHLLNWSQYLITVYTPASTPSLSFTLATVSFFHVYSCHGFYSTILLNHWPLLVPQLLCIPRPLLLLWLLLAIRSLLCSGSIMHSYASTPVAVLHLPWSLPTLMQCLPCSPHPLLLPWFLQYLYLSLYSLWRSTSYSR